MWIATGIIVAFVGGFATCGLLYPDIRGLVDELKAHITTELNRITSRLSH